MGDIIMFKLFRKKKVSEPVKCDICVKDMQFEEGYLLYSDEVTTNQAYWDYAFRHQWSYLHDIDAEGNTMLSLVDRMFNQKYAWLVCEDCIELFSSQYKRMREPRMKEAMKSPDPRKYTPHVLLSGRDRRMGAARYNAAKAWMKLYGKPPKSLEEYI